MEQADVGKLELQPRACEHEGCPLLALSRSGRCSFHAVRPHRVNALDVHARPGLTMDRLFTDYASRRRAAANAFWMRANSDDFALRVERAVEVNTRTGEAKRTDAWSLLIATWYQGLELFQTSFELPPADDLPACERALWAVISSARSMVEDWRARAKAS